MRSARFSRVQSRVRLGAVTIGIQKKRMFTKVNTRIIKSMRPAMAAFPTTLPTSIVRPMSATAPIAQRQARTQNV